MQVFLKLTMAADKGESVDSEKLRHVNKAFSADEEEEDLKESNGHTGNGNVITTLLIFFQF